MTIKITSNCNFHHGLRRIMRCLTALVEIKLCLKSALRLEHTAAHTYRKIVICIGIDSVCVALHPISHTM